MGQAQWYFTGSLMSAPLVSHVKCYLHKRGHAFLQTYQTLHRASLSPAELAPLLPRDDETERGVPFLTQDPGHKASGVSSAEASPSSSPCNIKSPSAQLVSVCPPAEFVLRNVEIKNLVFNLSIITMPALFLSLLSIKHTQCHYINAGLQ
jgi:hypothetical protein